jgi:hypothetical protein
MDFSYLQLLQDRSCDLVPKHSTDGDDVTKYFQRCLPVMNKHQTPPNDN